MKEELNLKSLQEEFKEINNLNGEERALDLKYVIEYIKRKEGENKYNLLLEKLEEIGFELPDINELEKMDWIPIKIPAFLEIASAKFFNWKRQDVVDMGREFTTFSPLIKIFLKFFFSPEKTLKTSVNMWRKHYSIGELEFVDFSDKKKEMTLYLKNFETHLIDRLFLVGSFEKIGELALGEKRLRGDVKRKDDYYEFTFRWS